MNARFTARGNHKNALFLAVSDCIIIPVGFTNKYFGFYIFLDRILQYEGADKYRFLPAFTVKLFSFCRKA